MALLTALQLGLFLTTGAEPVVTAALRGWQGVGWKFLLPQGFAPYPIPCRTVAG